MGGGASQHECMKPSSVVYVDTVTREKKNEETSLCTCQCYQYRSDQKKQDSLPVTGGGFF